MKHKKQSGFLALMAVVIITVFAVLSASLSYLFISRTTSTNYLISSKRSFYMAGSGIEDALFKLNNPTLALRPSCSTLNESFDLSGNAATITPANASNFYSTTSNLDDAINSITITINITDTSSFAKTGRIYIDREAIDYLNNDTTNNQLSGITRGADNTLATSHTSGTTISQYQCYIQSTGNSPSSSSLGNSIIHIANQSQTTIAVGANQKIAQWNTKDSENNWATATGSINLNKVDLLNAHQGWAVGNVNGTNLSISRFNNGTWTNTFFNLAGLTSQNLHGISAVSSQDAWAVGELDNTTMTLLHWNGSTWTNISSTATPANLYDVEVLNTNDDNTGDFGFAVGGSVTTGGACQTEYTECIENDSLENCQLFIQLPITPPYSDSSTPPASPSCYTVISTIDQCEVTDKNKYYKSCFKSKGNPQKKCVDYIENCTDAGGGEDGAILQYNGTDWLDITINNSSDIKQLNSVSIIKNGSNTPVDAYAVGESSTSTGTILKWDNSASEWNIVSTPIQILHAISMIDTTGNGLADYGWAVGENGRGYEYKNSSWQNVTNISNGNDLFAVKVISKDDAWLAGANETIYHWNGTTWTQNEPAVKTNDTLRGIAVVSAKTKPQSGFQEILN